MEPVILPPAPGAPQGAPPGPPPDDEDSEFDPMDLALSWAGFTTAATRNKLREEGFDNFADLKAMKEKDVRDLAESYGRRTVNDGRFIFGIRRINYLIGMVNWVQDFSRINTDPGLDEFFDGAEFRIALEEANHRAAV
jgi:hypothetical protein